MWGMFTSIKSEISLRLFIADWQLVWITLRLESLGSWVLGKSYLQLFNLLLWLLLESPSLVLQYIKNQVLFRSLLSPLLPLLLKQVASHVRHLSQENDHWIGCYHYYC